MVLEGLKHKSVFQGAHLTGTETVNPTPLPSTPVEEQVINHDVEALKTPPLPPPSNPSPDAKTKADWSPTPKGNAGLAQLRPATTVPTADMVEPLQDGKRYESVLEFTRAVLATYRSELWQPMDANRLLEPWWGHIQQAEPNLAEGLSMWSGFSYKDISCALAKLKERTPLDVARATNPRFSWEEAALVVDGAFHLAPTLPGGKVLFRGILLDKDTTGQFDGPYTSLGADATTYVPNKAYYFMRLNGREDVEQPKRVLFVFHTDEEMRAIPIFQNGSRQESEVLLPRRSEWQPVRKTRVTVVQHNPVQTEKLISEKDVEVIDLVRIRPDQAGSR